MYDKCMTRNEFSNAELINCTGEFLENLLYSKLALDLYYVVILHKSNIAS